MSVTQANIESTINASAYTDSIRPPESITEPERIANAGAVRLHGIIFYRRVRLPHPAGPGRHPNDTSNLWVQPNDIPNATSVNNTKDLLEHTLNDLVCSGQSSLTTAQVAIATDWVTAHETYGGETH